MAGSKKFLNVWMDEAALIRLDRAAAEYSLNVGRVCKRSEFVRAALAMVVRECEKDAAGFAAMMKEGD